MPAGPRGRTPRRPVVAARAVASAAAALFLLALLPSSVPTVDVRAASGSLAFGPAATRLFPSAESAALDFARRWNARSIRERREYAAVLYRVVRLSVDASPDRDPSSPAVALEPAYAYTTPDAGAHDSSIPDFFGARGTPVGILHTHGAYGADEGTGNDDFSSGLFRDTWWSGVFGIPFYLATPDGRLRVHQPGDALSETATVADDLPWDPYHPRRLRMGGCDL